MKNSYSSVGLGVFLILITKSASSNDHSNFAKGLVVQKSCILILNLHVIAIRDLLNFSLLLKDYLITPDFYTQPLVP